MGFQPAWQIRRLLVPALDKFRHTVASGWFWAVVVGMATAAPRASLLAAQFVNWDDDRFIANNPLFQGPIIRYLVAAMTSLQFEAYQPLHLLSYLPDRLFWPHHPGGFHALNLALLSVNAGLLLILLEISSARGSLRCSPACCSA